MKVLYVMAGAKHGGAETALVDIALAMHESGVEVEVVLRANPSRVQRFRDAGVKVHILPFGGKIDFLTPLLLKKIIRNFKPDIVQCWMRRGAKVTPRWNEKMNIPRYVTVGRVGKDYNIKYFRTMDYMVSITGELKDHLIRCGIDESKIRIIHNFADVEAADTPIRRADYGTPDDVPLILGMGRLHNDKAFDVLIKAVEPIENAHVWIAGEGPLRAELEALIERLGLSARVKLLGWRDDRAALFQAVDICAFISRFEGFGTVFVQSWAQKTPLVVSDVNGPVEYVRHGEDGLMVKIDDVEATTAALRQLIDTPDYALRLVENGFQRYCEEFTKDICVQHYTDFYKSIFPAR